MKTARKRVSLSRGFHKIILYAERREYHNIKRLPAKLFNIGIAAFFNN